MESLKCEPQEMLGDSNTDPHKVSGCLGMDTRNDGLENVFPFKYVYFQYLTSMLSFRQCILSRQRLLQKGVSIYHRLFLFFCLEFIITPSNLT